MDLHSAVLQSQARDHRYEIDRDDAGRPRLDINGFSFIVTNNRGALRLTDSSGKRFTVAQIACDFATREQWVTDRCRETLAQGAVSK